MDHKVAKLENPERVKQMRREYVLDALGVRGEAAFADIGAGSGIFVRVAAHKTVGSIYAVEISDAFLKLLEEYKKAEHIANMEIVKATDNSVGCTMQSCDAVLLATVLHELENPEEILSEISRILKPEGVLGIIEWRDEATPMGPPLDHRISTDCIHEVLSAAGFKVLRQENLSDNFNFFVTTK